jgi:hypothetical protein
MWVAGVVNAPAHNRNRNMMAAFTSCFHILGCRCTHHLHDPLKLRPLLLALFSMLAGLRSLSVVASMSLSYLGVASLTRLTRLTELVFVCTIFFWAARA